MVRVGVRLAAAAAALAASMGMTAVAGAATANAGTAAAAGPATGYEPLAFLIGHCWKGTSANGTVSDEHCFSWIYGGKFVRDEHVVHRADGQPDAFGESIYVWDSQSSQLQYLYIESAGGYSRGTVTGGEPGTLVFPPTTYTEKGQAQTYRSRWQRVGSDAYDVVTEFRDGDRWVPGFTLHMQKVKT
jgi:hypothetical protein